MQDRTLRKKHAPTKIGSILRPLLDKIQIQKKQIDLSLNVLWYEIVGEKVVKHTKIDVIKNKILVIYAENSAWLNELTFLKENIRIKAKEIFSKQGINLEDIVFKLGKVK